MITNRSRLRLNLPQRTVVIAVVLVRVVQHAVDQVVYVVLVENKRVPAIRAMSVHVKIDLEFGG
jgi:hypothetical protein